MTHLERIIANPLPFAGLLGIEFLSAGLDAIEAWMVVRPDLCTLGDFAHGGAIMSFADTLGGAAALAYLSEDAKGTTTLESKTNFIAGAPAGSTLIGRCALVHRGRRTQIWQTRVETAEGKLVALVLQTQMAL